MTSSEININSSSQEKIDLIKRTTCKNCTDDELQLFIHACNRTGLDPFMRQIYAVKRSGSMTIQTGIDGYRVIAERTKKYMPGKECTFNYKNNKLFSATAYVKKLDHLNQWHEIAHTVFWDEYAVSNNQNWKNMPCVMLGKCAEAALLRKCFPADLSGLYTKDEMDQAGNPKETEDEMDQFENPQEIDKSSSNKTIISSSKEIKKEEDFIDPCPEPNLISQEQLCLIQNLIEPGDEEYRQQMLKFFSSKMGKELKDFSEIPASYMPAFLASIHRRQEFWNKKKLENAEKLQKESENSENKDLFKNAQFLRPISLNSESFVDQQTKEEV